MTTNRLAELARDQLAIANAQRDRWAGDPVAAERVRRGAAPMADFAADLSAQPEDERPDGVIIAGADRPLTPRRRPRRPRA
jgi:hypothetical protein